MGCVSCPECQAILKIGILEEKCCAVNISTCSSSSSTKRDVTKDDDMKRRQFTHVCVYKCGYCQWDSTECGIYRTLELYKDKDDTSLPNEQCQEGIDEIVRIAREELVKDLTIALAMHETSTAFQALQSCWMERNSQLQKMRRRAGLLRNKSTTDASGFAKGTSDHAYRRKLYIANEVDLQRLQDEGKEEKFDFSHWDVDKLEETVEKRKVQIANQVSKSIDMNNISDKESLLKVTGKNIGLESIGEGYWGNDSDCTKLLNNDPDVEVRQQLVGSVCIPTQSNMHLPIPVPLRARAERRCIQEIQAGRPGILLKPKVNPLEGDTSLRYGHGQWWKKDSSAIHSVPRVSIKAVKYDESTCRYALLLQIKNPTIGPIRLKIGTALEEKTKFPDSLEVVLDPLTFQKVNVNVIPTQNVKSSQPRMQQISLEAMEDAFLDVAKLIQNGPFDANEDAWVDWSSEENTCTLLSEQNDVAWIRYVTESITTPMKKELLLGENDPTHYFGIPLKMEVEVSDESWESSLIQVEEKQDNEKDFVSIYTLPVWKHSTC